MRTIWVVMSEPGGSLEPQWAFPSKEEADIYAARLGSIYEAPTTVCEVRFGWGEYPNGE